MKKLIKSKWIWILGVVLVGLIVGGYFAYDALRKPATSEAASQVQVAVARRGDLIIYASAVGVVSPAREISIGFDESGTLQEILVKVGEKVTNEQILARLKTNNTEESIAAAIASAELSVLKAKQALDDISDSWQMDEAQARLAIEQAEEALKDQQTPELQQAETQVAVVEAQTALEDAVTARQQLNDQRCDDDTIAEYEADYYLKLANYKELKRIFNKKFSGVSKTDPDRLMFQSRLYAAEDQVENAEINLNWCWGKWSEDEIAEADANVQLAKANLSQAQQAYEASMSGATSAEVAVLEAQLADVQRAWERIKDGPDLEEIELAEAQLTTAQAQLDLAKQGSVFVDLEAPMDGTIMSIDGSVGERVSSGALITLADLDQPLLEIYLDETDLDKVAVGYEVEATFDAFPDQTFTGHVTEVNPSLQRVSNVSTVYALVSLDVDSYAKPQSLPVGLNASVDVIAGKALDAVLVPVEALREIAPGEYGVFVMQNNEPRLRTVTVGLMDFTYAEITSGLEAGEEVTTGLVETE